MTPKADEKPLWDGIGMLLLGPALLLMHDLHLFAALADGPRALGEIAKALGIAPRPARALLTSGVALGVLERNDDCMYGLSAVGRQYLLAESSTYFGSFLDGILSNRALMSFDVLKQAVLTDRPPAYDGKELFQTNELQPALARVFTRAMHGHSVGPALTWPTRLDLSCHRRLLDIGGGSGSHAMGAVQQWPQLKATVFELPPICALAQEMIDEKSLGDRVGVHAGDMWHDPYPQADLHFYADIFHDWPLAKIRALVNKSFGSLPSGGRLIAHEMLYHDDLCGPSAAAGYALTMLLWTEGQQYSGAELSALLSEVGFIDVAVVPSLGYWSLVTGCKP